MNAEMYLMTASDKGIFLFNFHHRVYNVYVVYVKWCCHDCSRKRILVLFIKIPSLILYVASFSLSTSSRSSLEINLGVNHSKICLYYGWRGWFFPCKNICMYYMNKGWVFSFLCHDVVDNESNLDEKIFALC